MFEHRISFKGILLIVEAVCFAPSRCAIPELTGYLLGMRTPDIYLSSLIRVAAVGLICEAACYADDGPLVREAARLATNVTVRLQAAGELSSGVVIGKAGEILTVNHGLPAGVPLVRVTDSNGIAFNAEVLQRNQSLDLALLKIVGVEVPENVAVIASSGAVADQPVIASGYPATESTSATALIRLGAIERVNQGLIRATCQLTSGDSGGGIFDLDGRLIGLNQRIGVGRSANIHATISRCFDAVPFARRAATVDANSSPPRAIDGNDDRNPREPPAAIQAWKTRTLQVLISPRPDSPQRQPDSGDSEGGDSEVLCHATLWSPRIAITKLSELRQHKEVQLRTSDHRTVTARIVKEDRSNDLAVLAMGESLSLDDVPGYIAPSLHQLVASGPGPDNVAIVGRTSSSTPSAKPVLGCGLAVVDSRIQIDRISPNSAAAKANLKVGDLVVKINNTSIGSLDAVALQLQLLQPGDWSVFEVLRHEELVTCHLQLQHDAAEILDRTGFLDGAIRAVSLRRTGFPNVLQHDGDLRPSLMGSPLLSLQGNVLGINIAVRSREAVLAIPSKIVQALVDQLD